MAITKKSNKPGDLVDVYPYKHWRATLAAGASARKHLLVSLNGAGDGLVLANNQLREIYQQDGKFFFKFHDVDIGLFSNLAFPLVRRVFSKLIANELVSVQPMSSPSGLLFGLDYSYSDNGDENE